MTRYLLPLSAWLPLVLLGGSYACSSDDSAERSSDRGASSAAPSGDAIASFGPGEGGLLHGAGGSGATDEGEDGGTGQAGSSSEGVPLVVANPEPREPPFGQLTAGIFDDNLSFSFFTDFRQASIQDLPGVPRFTQAELEAAHAGYPAAQRTRSRLDVALVIDTTGSMGDELSYLVSEFGELSQAIGSRYPNAEQRWAFVLYRDQGDEYLTKTEPFTSNLGQFAAQLAKQEAGGGGDYPEAVADGLLAANELGWRSGDDVARLAFWVADAPHHEYDKGRVREAILGAQQLDLHLYPVAASGVDLLTEVTMRTAAQLTLGRYLFLTDDSGIGNSHAEPTLPCYYVTTLRDAILRGVDAEMSGEIAPPSAEQLIRVGGALNTEGNCYYGDGYSAVPF